MIPKYDWQLTFLITYFFREQTFDILFDGDEEEKSLATCLLDSLLKVQCTFQSCQCCWDSSPRGFRRESDIFLHNSIPT